MRITLASYNIHRCIGRDRCKEPDRIIEVLKELEADVIALQEVESPGDTAHEFVQYLGRETGMTAIAGPTLLRETGHYGNALLTRAEVRGLNRFDLARVGREPRGAIDATLECDGTIFQIVATHLGLRPWERRAQIRLLLGLFPDDPVQPCALLGDFNEWLPWGRPLRWLHAYFGKPPAPATFPSGLPFLALDRVWVHPVESLVSITAHATGAARHASDHLPVKAVVEW